MANEDSALREVDQELAEERQWRFFRQYGPAAIGAGLAIIVGVGAWQIWTGAREASAERAALEFSAAIETAAEDPAAGRDAFAAIAESDAPGYAVLAQFRRAAVLAAEGAREDAEAVFVEIYSSGDAPAALKSLARVRAAHLALADGRDAALAHLGDLANADGPFAHHAAEVAGVGALDAEDYETALSIFRGLSIDIAAPEAVRLRAEQYAALAAAGRSGVNIKGDVRVDDVLSAVGPVAPAAGGEDVSDGAPEAQAAPADGEIAQDGADEAPDTDEAPPVEDVDPSAGASDPGGGADGQNSDNL